MPSFMTTTGIRRIVSNELNISVSSLTPIPTSSPRASFTPASFMVWFTARIVARSAVSTGSSSLVGVLIHSSNPPSVRSILLMRAPISPCVTLYISEEPVPAATPRASSNTSVNGCTSRSTAMLRLSPSFICSAVKSTAKFAGSSLTSPGVGSLDAGIGILAAAAVRLNMSSLPLTILFTMASRAQLLPVTSMTSAASLCESDNEFLWTSASNSSMFLRNAATAAGSSSLTLAYSASAKSARSLLWSSPS